jgi:hypothetical protein
MRSLKKWWDYIQALLDVDGDAIMFVFTSAVIYRIVKGPPLGEWEAAVYASAVACFAYSNRGPK